MKTLKINFTLKVIKYFFRKKELSENYLREIKKMETCILLLLNSVGPNSSSLEQKRKNVQERLLMRKVYEKFRNPCERIDDNKSTMIGPVTQ